MPAIAHILPGKTATHNSLVLGDSPPELREVVTVLLLVVVTRRDLVASLSVPVVAKVVVADAAAAMAK